MNKKNAAILALIAAIGVAWWSLFSQLGSGAIDTGPYRALGEAAARQVAATLHKSGRVVIVDADLGEYKLLAPINAAQISTFKKVLSRTPIEIAATEKVPVTPPSMSRNGIFMQPGQLAAVLARHARVDAIVLFVGLSGPDDLPAKAGPDRRPKLIVIGNYDRYYPSLVQQHVIDLAIVPNPNDPPTEEGVRQVAEWFQRHYRVITPENPTSPGE